MNTFESYLLKAKSFYDLNLFYKSCACYRMFQFLNDEIKGSVNFNIKKVQSILDNEKGRLTTSQKLILIKMYSFGDKENISVFFKKIIDLDFSYIEIEPIEIKKSFYLLYVYFDINEVDISKKITNKESKIYIFLKKIKEACNCNFFYKNNDGSWTEINDKERISVHNYKDVCIKNEVSLWKNKTKAREIFDLWNGKNEELDISIIMPTYNVQEFIEKSVKSALSQTTQNLEILCIDDGSTDNTLNIIQKLSDKDDRIKVVRQSNAGAGKARNKGLQLAKGKYICFLDADDYYPESNSLEMLLTAANKNNVDICGGNLLYELNSEISSHNDQRMNLKKYGVIKYKDYQFDYGFWRFMYKNSFLKKNYITFPTYRRFQDPPFFVKAMATAEFFYTICYPVYCWKIGYKKVKFDEEIISDFISGLTDNLIMSRNFNFAKLHQLCISRINYDANLLEIKKFSNSNIKSKLVLFNDNIDYDLLARSGISLKAGYKIRALV